MEQAEMKAEFFCSQGIDTKFTIVMREIFFRFELCVIVV